MAALLPTREVFLSTLRTVRIAKLPDGYTGNVTCSICFGDLADRWKKGASERAVRLHGTHVFGELCIRRWLEENDSCPTCRKKIHAGADNDEGRLVDALNTQRSFLMRWRPTIDRPIVDVDIFELLDKVGRARMTVTSVPHLRRLEYCWNALLIWRAEWWERNPLCVSLPDFAPYTRTQALRVEDFETEIVLHEERFSRIIGSMVHIGIIRGLSNTERGLPLHVGAHPLYRGMEYAMRRRVRVDQGQRMAVSTLAIRLRNSLESDPQTRGVLTGERKDLPRDLQFYWEDVIVVVLLELIKEQQHGH